MGPESSRVRPGPYCHGSARMARKRDAARQLALRFLTAFFTAGALVGSVAGAALPDEAKLARSASIRFTTLSGAGFFAAAIGRPFCFLASSSASAVS
jgi:hypothetical protein